MYYIGNAHKLFISSLKKNFFINIIYLIGDKYVNKYIIIRVRLKSIKYKSIYL